MIFSRLAASFAYQNLPSPLLSRVRIITKLGEQTDSLALISLFLSPRCVLKKVPPLFCLLQMRFKVVFNFSR